MTVEHSTKMCSNRLISIFQRQLFETRSVVMFITLLTGLIKGTKGVWRH